MNDTHYAYVATCFVHGCLNTADDEIGLCNDHEAKCPKGEVESIRMLYRQNQMDEWGQAIRDLLFSHFRQSPVDCDG